MRLFLRYAADVIGRPRATFRAVLADPHRVYAGLGGLLAMSAAYGISISIGLKRHPEWTPDRRPALRIPPERYYTYERFFILPVAIGETVITAGIARLIAQSLGGRGRFEDLFALLGLSHTTVVLSMRIPDTIEHVLPRRFRSHPYVYAGTVWMLALMALAVKEAERVSWAESAVVVLPAALANATVEYVFIR